MKDTVPDNNILSRSHSRIPLIISAKTRSIAKDNKRKYSDYLLLDQKQYA